MIDNPYLLFTPGNAKLANRGIAVFSLPAGITCPGAKDCLARFDRTTRKIIDGPQQSYRCYAASTEIYPSAQKHVDHNFGLLKKAKTVEAMTDLIHESLPRSFYFDKVRIHSDGDFFNADYFLAWTQAAARTPNKLFYAYTKSIPHWIRHKNMIPKNMVLNASLGGKFDSLAKANDLKTVVVVYHPEEAAALGLSIDHDDNLAMDPDIRKFALLLHGTQPKGSEAAEALKRMKRENIKFSYGKGNTPAY